LVHVRAFKALRYNKEKVGDFSKIIAPPYDVISREHRDELRKRSPYNCIHITLGEELDENMEQGLHAKAAENLDKWIEEGVLVQEENHAIYAYEQIYSLKGGRRCSRKGIIPLVRLEPFEKRKILPHEFTLAPPKEDRLSLLRATKTNTEEVFAMYHDPSGKIKALLEKVTEREPAMEAKDDNGVISRLWVMDDPKEIGLIEQVLKDKELYIADGHHRYETHLKYAKENPKADSMPMLLVERDDAGLNVLPTHRVMHSLEGFSFEEFKDSLQDWFDVEEIDADNRILEETLGEKEGKSFLARSGGDTVLFSLKDSADLSEHMPDKLEEIRGLDVSILHDMVLDKKLGVSAEKIAAKENIEFVKDFNEAIKKADSQGYNIAFLMNSTKKDQVVASCLVGQRMPQKSTYFYPKMCSGFIFRKIG